MKHFRLLVCLMLSLVIGGFQQVFATGTATVQSHLSSSPDSLPTSEGRASWLAAHYWDNFDFTAGTLPTNLREALESNFSTWAELLNQVHNPEERTEAVKTLIAKASVNHEALMELVEIADTYLYDPSSPYADEAKYMPWVESLLESGQLDDIEAIRPKMQLEEMRLNPVGGKAVDITVMSEDGSRRPLYSLLDKKKDTLLFFYDPDCHDCGEAVPEVTEAVALPNAPAVIAVCVEGSPEDWASKRAVMPQGWTHVYAADLLSQSLDEQGPYILPVMPTFYLLSPDGTIKTKNWKPDRDSVKRPPFSQDISAVTRGADLYYSY